MSGSFVVNGRRFSAGDTFRMSGMDFRVRQGRKAPDDIVIDWCTSSGWVPIGFDVLGLLHDFFYENEEVLYPSPMGYMGGAKVTDFERFAVKHGHDAAIHRLESEKRMKQSRLFEDGAA